MTFYGFGDEGTSEDDGLDFNIEGVGLVQQVKFRIARSPVFVGLKYVFASTDTRFDTQSAGPISGETDLAGVSGLVEYDTRNTVFTPSKGLRASLILSWFAQALGGDFDYGSVGARLRYYWPVAQDWILGFRADAHPHGVESRE